MRKIELNHEVKGENTMEQLQVKCKGFEEGDWIPIRYTGHGKYVGSLGATQGKAYGRHKYRGPKPPLKAIHNYVFTVYILDCKIELDAGSRKRDLLNKMEGHILQQATLTGKFQSRRE
jgi:hypothetical protein